MPIPLRIARNLMKPKQGEKDAASVQDTPVIPTEIPTTKEAAKDAAIDAGNQAIQNTPEMIAAKQAQRMLAPGLNKEFDKVTNVGTYANALPGLSAFNATDASEVTDEQIEEDLGWINYYRKKFRDATSPEGEDSYFNFDKYKEQVMNNLVVKTTKNVIENKILALTQSLAEMMNLVKQGENVMDLNPEELDKRVDKLNTLIQDPKMQEKIAETAQHVADASKEPLKEMTAELTKLTSDFAKDATEQGAQIAVSAVGAIPGPGNVISVLNAAKKTTDLITDVADKTKEAVDIASKAGEEIGEKIKEAEEEVEAKANVSLPKVPEVPTIKMPTAMSGGAKAIKSHINASTNVLKRVNKSLKEHFNQFKKNVTKRVIRQPKDSKSKKRRYIASMKLVKTRKK